MGHTVINLGKQEKWQNTLKATFLLPLHYHIQVHKASQTQLLYEFKPREERQRQSILYLDQHTPKWYIG